MNKLIILCGIPFSGKSTLAKAISKKLGYKHVDLDEIKFLLFGSDTNDNDLNQSDWDYIYKKMYQEIEYFLTLGKTVIQDTGNFTKSERDLVRQIADRLGIETTTIFVDTPQKIAYRRLLQNKKLQTRFMVSEKDFESAVLEMEIPTASENVVMYNNNDDMHLWINRYLR